MKAIAIACLLCLGHLFAYEVQITDPPRIDALPDTRVFAAPTEDKTTLLEFLGGKEKIKKIVIGIIANEKHGELNESVVQTRFADSVCMDSRKQEWHYAPFAMGTVYFVGGGRQSFSLHLSGISIAGHLFALPQKPKAEQAGTGQPATRPESKTEGSDKPQPESEGRSR
jgi:hypothetical protein